MRRTRLGLHALALLALLASVTSTGCDKKSDATPTPDTGASKVEADAMTIPQAASGVVSARPGCHAVVEGGARVAGMLEPTSVTVAVVKGKALVINTLFTEGGKGDGGVVPTPENASASRVVLSATTGALESKPEPVTEPHTREETACCPLTWAVATPFGGELATLSLGVTRSGPQGCAGGTVMLKGAGAPKTVTTGHCHFTSALAGAARGDVAIAVTDGIVDPTKGSVPAVDAILFAAGKAKTVRLESFAMPQAAAAERVRIDAPVAAVGIDGAAAAYRVTRGTTQELHVVKLAPDGTKVGKVEILDRGVVGTPALAFEGDTLHVVWATRATDKDPYALHWTKWAPNGAPQAHQKLGTGVLSAYSPSLAIDSGRFLLAWTEGDKTGVVKAGASASGLTGALALAGVVSNAGVDAKSPKVALDRDHMFIVWQEVADAALAKEAKEAKELRASPLRCQE